jgi:hypothetical protein
MSSSPNYGITRPNVPGAPEKPTYAEAAVM